MKFYDLGSGNGKIIARIANAYPNLACVGIECNIAAYSWAKLRNLFSKQKVLYRMENFFQTNLGDADIVYAYLFPNLMKRLEPKFTSELKKGTLLIVNSFPLKSKEPLKIIQDKTNALGTLYIYEY